MTKERIEGIEEAEQTRYEIVKSAAYFVGKAR
jgi:hypothetical protein